MKLNLFISRSIFSFSNHIIKSNFFRGFNKQDIKAYLNLIECDLCYQQKAAILKLYRRLSLHGHLL